LGNKPVARERKERFKLPDKLIPLLSAWNSNKLDWLLFAAMLAIWGATLASLCTLVIILTLQRVDAAGILYPPPPTSPALRAPLVHVGLTPLAPVGAATSAPGRMLPVLPTPAK